MRYILVFVLSLFVITSAARAETVKVATFNVYWLFNDQPPHKKWWDDVRGSTGQTYNQALDGVADVIKTIDADVIALQEVEDASVVSDLQTTLQGRGVDYPHSWISKGADSYTGQDVALLSKFPSSGPPVREYPNERETYMKEIDAGNEGDTGLSKVLRVDLNISGKTLPVFVLHLKSQIGGFEADQKRLAQASIIRRLTLPLIEAGEKFVVMGDLNADRGSPTLRRIRGLDDVFADLSQPAHSDRFEGDKWTYRYAGRGQQIDHILLSPTLRKSLQSGQVIYGHGEDVSDHSPLLVTVELN